MFCSCGYLAESEIGSCGLPALVLAPAVEVVVFGQAAVVVGAGCNGGEGYPRYICDLPKPLVTPSDPPTLGMACFVESTHVSVPHGEGHQVNLWKIGLVELVFAPAGAFSIVSYGARVDASCGDFQPGQLERGIRRVGICVSVGIGIGIGVSIGVSIGVGVGICVGICVGIRVRAGVFIGGLGGARKEDATQNEEHPAHAYQPTLCTLRVVKPNFHSLVLGLVLASASACDASKLDSSDSSDPVDTEGEGQADSADSVESLEETGGESHSGESLETGVVGLDADGDGHLSEEDGGSDCDDGNPAVHPDALEQLANGLDDDCDGVVDTLDAENATASFVDLEIGGGAGLAVAGLGDINGTGGGAYAIGAPYSAGAGESGGQVYLFLGEREGFVDLAEADAVLLGATESEAGKALSGGGDVNNDGYADLLVGGYHGAEGAGVTWVVHGPILGEQVLDEVAVRLVGQSAYDFSACAVDFAGDVDGDGDDEVLVGAYHASTTTHGSYDGAAYLVDPPQSGSLSLDDAIRIVGESVGDEAGYAVAGPGDLDGDGLSDVVVGARYESTAGEYAGAVYVFLSPLSVAVNASDADARYLGEVPGGYAGSALSGAGDVDGDGRVDFVVGSRRHDGVGDSSGAAHLLRGPALSGGSLLNADARLLGEATGDRAGWAVSGAGDFDGDGRDDLLIGAPRHSSGGRLGGAAYVVLGPVDPVLDLAGSNGRIVSGAEEMLLGISVAGVGDLDSDGRSDLLVGAERGDIFLVTSGLR